MVVIAESGGEALQGVWFGRNLAVMELSAPCSWRQHRMTQRARDQGTMWQAAGCEEDTVLQVVADWGMDPWYIAWPRDCDCGPLLSTRSGKVSTATLRVPWWYIYAVRSNYQFFTGGQAAVVIWLTIN